MSNYSSLREKISAEREEREARYAAYELYWQQANMEGFNAASKCIPAPMIVTDRDGNHVDYVADGVCGFAWINVPGNTSFGRWLKKKGIARPDYPKGLSYWISAYEQSYERKRAHAYAMANYLKKLGIECSARSRLD